MKRPRLTPQQVHGITAALISAVVLGLPPIFGRQAILQGTAPLTVVMLRTLFAMLALWATYLISPQLRKYIYIYPVGLAGCMVAGLLNGIGSVAYYAGLGRLNASLVQLIFTLYTIFLTLLARLDGHPISRFTYFRLGLALGAVYLITGVGAVRTDWIGGLLVLFSGFMYALHVAVNQHVLFDMPAPTVALYTITAMAITVSVAYFSGGYPAMPTTQAAWQFVLLLTLVTVISRLALFTGVKYLGGVQAALLGLSEALVTVFAATLFLGEQFTPLQWAGAAMLGGSILLVMREKNLGVLPQPQPWFQILAAWQARWASEAAARAAKRSPRVPPAPAPHPPTKPGD